MKTTLASRVHLLSYPRALWSVVGFAVVALVSLHADAASSGTVITIAGNGAIGYSGDGGPATNAQLNYCEGLAFGRDGTLYIADSGNFRIRAVDPTSGVIRTIAGTGVEGDQGNGGPATNATITSVIGLATDRVRNSLYLTDWANNWVRKVDLNTGILTVYAGSGDFGFTGDGGPAAQAKMLFPLSAGTDAAGRLSFLDVGNARIRRVDPVTGNITTIGGSGVSGEYLGDGGPATGAAFGNAIRVTADPAGNVYLRDGDPNGTYFTVRRIDAASGIITTIVGGGTNAPGTGVATNMFSTTLRNWRPTTRGDCLLELPIKYSNTISPRDLSHRLPVMAQMASPAMGDPP
jgi:trimeric autotransporter adhesin